MLIRNQAHLAFGFAGGCLDPHYCKIVIIEEMRFPMKKQWMCFFVLAAYAGLYCAPVITNLTAAQRSDTSKKVDIFYDVADNFPLTVTLQVSADNGATWTYPCVLVTGDIGSNISPGGGKHIVWDVLAEHPNISGTQFKFKVLADDGQPPPIPDNFVLVPGNSIHFSFWSGTTVVLSSFYIDKYEITQAEFQSVMGVNPSHNYGVGGNFPVYYVTWFKAIEYCNRRSLQEGETPCYSYGSCGTNPDNWPAGWNTSNANHTNISCNWNANGYRLPTECEWMFAAMAANPYCGYSYSGGNDVNAVAWYSGNAGGTTHLVATKAPNGLGTYDQSGNIMEWTWDIPCGYYNMGTVYDPHGATSGTSRGMHGGDWSDPSPYCAWFTFCSGEPMCSLNWIGFRICRKCL